MPVSLPGGPEPAGDAEYEPDQILADQPLGLHKLGGGSQAPMRVTIGIASHNVAAIRLRNENNACERPLGAAGFFLLGITYQDPVTYAYAINREGEPLLL